MPKQVNKDVDDAKVPMRETNEVIPQRMRGWRGETKRVRQTREDILAK